MTSIRAITPPTAAPIITASAAVPVFGLEVDGELKVGGLEGLETEGVSGEPETEGVVGELEPEGVVGDTGVGVVASAAGKEKTESENNYARCM